MTRYEVLMQLILKYQEQQSLHIRQANLCKRIAETYRQELLEMPLESASIVLETQETSTTKGANHE